MNNVFTTFTTPITTNKEFLTPEEAAEIMRVSTRTIYEMLRNNKLPATQFGRQWRIRVSDILPSDIGVLIQEALEVDAQGLTELALFKLEHIVRIHPYYALGHWLLGTLAGRSRDYEKAIHHLQQAINLNSEYKLAYYNLGVAYNYLGDSQAFSVLEKALELDPNYADTYYQLGYAYSYKRSYLEAIKMFEEAIKRDPNNTMAYHFLARAYEHLKQPEKAQQIREELDNLATKNRMRFSF